MQLTLEGIVLREYKTGRNRVLHILTAEHGVITAFANNAVKPRSGLAATTELLCYCTFVLFHSRDRYTVDRADSNRLFFGIRQDIEKLALASWFAQLSDEICPHGVEAPEHLRLLLNTLHYLEQGARPRTLLKALFELRALTLAGLMPNLVACRECAAFEDPGMHFFPRSGDLLCGNCLESRRRDEFGISVAPSVLAGMRHIIYAEHKKLFSFSLSEQSLTGLARTVEHYLKYQVDKTFPALEFYNSLFSMPGLPPEPGA